MNGFVKRKYRKEKIEKNIEKIVFSHILELEIVDSELRNIWISRQKYNIRRYFKKYEKVYIHVHGKFACNYGNTKIRKNSQQFSCKKRISVCMTLKTNLKMYFEITLKGFKTF